MAWPSLSPFQQTPERRECTCTSRPQPTHRPHRPTTRNWWTRPARRRSSGPSTSRPSPDTPTSTPRARGTPSRPSTGGGRGRSPGGLVWAVGAMARGRGGWHYHLPHCHGPQTSNRFVLDVSTVHCSVCPKSPTNVRSHRRSPPVLSPPYPSIWYVGLGVHTEAVYGACRTKLDSAGAAAATGAGAGGASASKGGKGAGGVGGKGAGGSGGWAVTLARSVDALREAKAVPTAKRLNPKQRARLKKKMGVS